MTDVASRALGAAGPVGESLRVAAGVPRPPAAGVPAEVAAWVAAGRAVLAVAGHADAWQAGTRRAVLGELDRLDRLLAAVRGKVVTAEREAGTWSLTGDRDLAGFLGAASRQGRGAGLAAVGQAGTLAAMPAVAKALVDGPVTPTHLAQLTRATAGSAALAAELATPTGQERVVQLAGRLDGTQFGKALAQLSASLDPSRRQRTHDEQRADRFLLVTHTPSGTLIQGRLDSVAGHELGKALDALSPRPAIDDDRSRQQRHADALTAMARRVLTDPRTTPDALAPVQAVVTFTQETWTALRATRQADRSSGSRSASKRTGGGEAKNGGDGTGSHTAQDSAPAYPSAAPQAEGQPTPVVPVPGSALDVMDRLRGVDPVVDEAGQSWPASEVARALCDCALTWAVVGTRGADLNLGRQSRLFQRQHWLALYAAGTRSCAVPGCGMPLAYTELHHLAWWRRDHGPTNQHNCAPYCSYHHHDIHRLAITITRQADGSLEHRYPDGRRYGSPPEAAEGRSLPSHEAVPAERDGPGGADDGLHSAASADWRIGGPPNTDAHRTRSSGSPDAGGGEDPPPDLLTLLSA